MYVFRFTNILQDNNRVIIYITAKFSKNGELEILQHRAFTHVPELIPLSEEVSETILENLDCIHNKKWNQEFKELIKQEIKAKNYMYFLGETIDDTNEM